MNDGRFWRGALLLLLLLLGGPVLIAALGGAWQFASQPARFAVTVEGGETAVVGQPATLRLRVSNPSDDPLILWSATLDASLGAALGTPAFDPAPYQTDEAADGATTYLFNRVLDPGAELLLSLRHLPTQAGAAAGELRICRPGGVEGCTAVPLTLTISPDS